jgi:hypothetical protein
MFTLQTILSNTLRVHSSHVFFLYIIHHQPINVPTAGAQPSLCITHKDKGPQPIMQAQCELVGPNDCKCSRDQQLNVPSEAQRNSR